MSNGQIMKLNLLNCLIVENIRYHKTPSSDMHDYDVLASRTDTNNP